MAHFARTQSDATWTTGNYITLVSDWIDLDTKISKAVDGDLGGVWAPASLMTITGTGGGLVVQGPTFVDYGGSLELAGGALFKLGASPDWPLLAANHVGRTRTIVTSCVRRQSSPRFHWITSPTWWAAQSIACTLYIVATGAVKQPTFHLPLRVHDGARLTSATLTFRVPTPRTSAPIVPPRLRIVRVSTDGTIVPLKSTASGADPNGYVSIASPTNGTLWYAGGLVQSFVYACDQNNTIDVSQYAYHAQLIEETGSLAVKSLKDCDGILVRADWGTSPPSNASTNFNWSPGYLYGDANGAYWEDLDSSQPTAPTAFTYGRRTPRGNVYHAVSCAFDSIADMRWQ